MSTFVYWGRGQVRLTAFGVEMTDLWDTAKCSLVEVDKCFGAAYCLHYHGNGTFRIYTVVTNSIKLAS
jgi:hypothetical protein